MMTSGIRAERKGCGNMPRPRACVGSWRLAALPRSCRLAPPRRHQRPTTSPIDPKNGDGLGGTGIRSEHVAEIRHGDGLGGTGIVGTISGFGSIIVNGLELQFDRSTAVATDGRPAALEELRIGQVVQGLARRKDGRLTLETLDIQHAVSGPIGAIDHAAQTMTVLGQNIRLNLGGDKVAMKAFATLRDGDMVSVSGLRLNDGVIIASRVDQHEDDGRLVVRGEAANVSSDRVRIGGLDVPMSPDIAVSKPTQGGRVFVSGRMINGSFVPDVVTGGAGLPFDGKAGEVSLEGYAPERGAPLSLSGRDGQRRSAGGRRAERSYRRHRPDRRRGSGDGSGDRQNPHGRNDHESAR